VSAAPVEIALTPADLLLRARDQRTRGRFADARDSYERLLASYPDTEEGRAALVSLGQMNLVELRNPEAALRLFDRYAGLGGVLLEEALLGRVRALGRLGRRDAERDAIDTFLARFPESAHAAGLRAQRR
jgi:tetratricopeptide (TPR) repeat protein